MKRIIAALLFSVALLLPGTAVGAAQASSAPASPANATASFQDNYWFVLEHCGTRGGLHGIIYVCALHKPATLYIGGPGQGSGGHWKMTSLRWTHWNRSYAYARGVLWGHGPTWQRKGWTTITLYRARQFFMSTGYYTRAKLAPRFRINHYWKWIWYRDGSTSGYYLYSGKWVVN